MLNPEIFRQYDIRGIAGKDMTEEDVEQLGRGIGTYLRRNGSTKITVGRDCRVTADAYAERLFALVERMPQAVIIARDDHEQHWDFARPFLERGLPVFLDKPLSLEVEELRRFRAEAAALLEGPGETGEDR